ncbi:hypothetical protein Tco_0604121, partial [Tanacetum coccineum]
IDPKFSEDSRVRLSVRGNSRRTKNDRVKYEWDAKQGLVGNLKSSCMDKAKITRETVKARQTRTRERKREHKSRKFTIKGQKSTVTPPNPLQRKTRFGIVTSWREEDLIREIDLYMPLYQCRLHIYPVTQDT